MKTVVLQNEQEYLGRIKRKGEFLTVPDSFQGGRTIARDIEVKNRRITNQLRERSRREAKQNKLPDSTKKRA